MPTSVHVRTGPPKVLVVVFAGLALLGAAVTWRGIEFLLSPDAPRDAVIGPLLVGIILMGAGIAGAVLVARAGTVRAVRDGLQAAHPGKPWAWREDWASGRVAGNARAGALGLLVFALVWNGFTWPVAWLFLTKDDIGGGAEYLVLFFPGVGVLVLALALRALLQARKYGRSVFVLETNPGVIGRSLQGFVETTVETAPPDGVEVRLRCERRRRSRRTSHRSPRRGRNRSTQTTTLWQDHVTVEPLELTRGIGGIRIPVSFELPADVPPYNDADPYDTITWRLDVTAAVPGIDYGDSFDVPVFRTDDLPFTDAERETFRSRRRVRARSHVPDAPLFSLTRTPQGGSVFLFTPRTKPGTALGVVATTLALWALASWLFVRGVAIVPWVVVVLAFLFTVGTVVALFHRSSVTIEGGRVILRHRMLGIGPTRHLDAGEVKDIRTEVVGEGSAQSWEVTVATSAGKSYSAAAHFTSQRDADWVAEQLRAAIKGVV